MSTPVTPRVNSSMLPDYKSKTVRIIGKVVKLEGETATIECSDNGQVVVKLNRESNFSEGHFFEIVAKVTGDNTINELVSYDFGDNIDMALAEKVVLATHKHSIPFAGSGEVDEF